MDPEALEKLKTDLWADNIEYDTELLPDELKDKKPPSWWLGTESNAETLKL